MARIRLNLPAIEASLREVQRDFARINASLETPRDPLGEQVLLNLLAGYDYLDRLLGDGVDLLARGNSQHLLRLNLLVLYGDREPASEGGARHVAETVQRFYDDNSPGGLRALVNYLADHPRDDLWRRAAGIYVLMLSEPQMFQEGNHRTGALIISGLLCRSGQPPFVLSTGNAKAWLDPSSLIKGCRKRSLKCLLAIPKLRSRVANLLYEQGDRRFLLT